MAPERVQKILARAGISSRRAAEELIEQGRVMVNGKKATLGMSADAAADDIRLDGERIHMPTSFNYFLLNKPKGVISDEDVVKEHQTARDLIPVEGHLYPVGRLDLQSEGLMLFTNDGALAHRLTHPRFDHPKTYEVIVDANPTEEALDQWRNGIVLEGVKTRPAQVAKVRKTRQGTVLVVTLREGRKRQIRKVAARLGMPVISLVRTKLGPLELGDLPVGAWRRLTADEVSALQTLREMPEPRKPRGAARAQGTQRGTRRPLPKGTGTRTGPSSSDRRGTGKPSRYGDDSREDRPSRARPASGTRSEDRPARGVEGRPASRPSSRTSDERDTRGGSGKPASRTPRSDDARREDRPARATRRWPSEERRGAARTEVQGGERGGTRRPARAGDAKPDDRPSRGGTSRPTRSGDEKRDERPSRPGRARPASGDRPYTRSEDRPTRGGADKPPARTSRFGDDNRDDKPARPSRRPSTGQADRRSSDDKPSRGGEGRPTRSGSRPASRPGGSRPGGGTGRPSGAGRSTGTGRTSGAGKRPASRPSGGTSKPRRPRKTNDSE